MNQANWFNCFIVKIPIRATQNKQMGRQFDMPDIDDNSQASHN